ncbi:MAG: twin-arginine translocation signal domain-containing protein [Gemmataceae bacterium]
MTTRRQFLRAAAVAGTGGALAVAGQADDPADRDRQPSEAQAAVDRGLAYLASSQAADGSYPDFRTGMGNVAVSGLAGLALMAGGHQPGRGKYGLQVKRAADYVTGRGNGQVPGYLQNTGVGPNHGAMYQHGFGALFLSEVYGMLQTPADQKKVRDALERAVALTLGAQHREGGWRYDPYPGQHDVSVSVAQLMALRAARNAGVFVPKSAVDKCVDYIKACQLHDGGFCYIKGQAVTGSAFARSAAAVVGLFCAGVYEGREVERGMQYLFQFLPGRRLRAIPGESRADHYYYGHYYAALAMWTAGGNYWAEWFPAIRDELLGLIRQTPNGVWNDWHGPAYGTAMACIILQLPNNYLPIMQK